MISLKRHHLIVVLALVLVCSISLNASAVNDINALNAELDKQQNPTPSAGNMLWLDFLKLIVVLGLIVGAAWSLVRIFSKQLNNKMQGTWIQVVDEVALGQNKGIVLCEVGEKLYAIGVSDHNINLLFEVNNPKLLEEISYSESNNETPKAMDLNDLKKIIFDRIRPKKTSSPSKKEFHILMDEQFQRLEQLANNVNQNETIIKRSDDDD